MHDRLDHPHFNVLKHITSTMNKDLTIYVSSDVCNSCQMVKPHRLPLSHVHERSLHSFDIIYVDLWGPFPIESGQGMICFLLLLVDDHSRFIWICVLKNKTKVVLIILHFEAYVQRQFSLAVKVFYSDSGTELKRLESHWFK